MLVFPSRLAAFDPARLGKVRVSGDNQVVGRALGHTWGDPWVERLTDMISSSIGALITADAGHR